VNDVLYKVIVLVRQLKKVMKQVLRMIISISWLPMHANLKITAGTRC